MINSLGPRTYELAEQASYDKATFEERQAADINDRAKRQIMSRRGLSRPSTFTKDRFVEGDRQRIGNNLTDIYMRVERSPKRVVPQLGRGRLKGLIAVKKVVGGSTKNVKSGGDDWTWWSIRIGDLR